MLIETAHLIEYTPAHHQAGTRYGRIITVPFIRTEQSVVALHFSSKNVVGVSFQPDHQAGVLDGTGAIKQLCSNYTDLRTTRPTRHLIQPARFKTLYVIIQK